MSLRRFGRNRNITPDNKCLIFYIYIWTLNIDIQSLYIYIYIYIYIQSKEVVTTLENRRRKNGLTLRKRIDLHPKEQQ